MGLRVFDHLQAMFKRPMRAVSLDQHVARVRLNPPGFGQRTQRFACAARPERLITPAKRKLLRLRKELDLTNPAGPELEVVAGEVAQPGQSLGVTNLGANVVDVLQRREVEMLSPNEGGQIFEKRLARA